MLASSYRTHYADQLSAPDLLDTGIRLAGWVQRRRDHGGVVFVDLRDQTGICQIVLDPEQFPDAHQLRMEFCLSVSGRLCARPDGTVNPDLATGMVELMASELIILSPADPLPFLIEDEVEVEELTRLEYRYLDLRRPRMAANLLARSQTISAMRRVMERNQFLEVETPTLVASTPEGARDLLVPSRLRRSHFYALPQSPQLFKQLLMVGGVERYYQIAHCYRDEDFRADRQIEFSQLDLEVAFWGREQVLELLEELLVEVVSTIHGKELELPLPRLTYQDAMARYGTDKPDLRFGMELVELTSVFAQTQFQSFARVIGQGGLVAGFNVGPMETTRSQLDGLIKRAQELGAKGLVWVSVEDGKLKSPVLKFLSEAEQVALLQTLSAQPGDLLLLSADRTEVVRSVLGTLRVELGQPADHRELAPLFVIDFPTFERDPAGQLTPSHHPFTAPKDLDMLEADPGASLSWAYDLVLNGSELGSGSVRIYNPEVQSQVFAQLGISAEEAEQRFGWFLRGLRYGTPPHAGFAIGIDRLVAILRNEPNIRQIIPFPKTQTGYDPLTGSPAPVEPGQLDELGIELLEPLNEVETTSE